jgi:putative inorganic carbon (HCO3(-)) transporter
LIHSTPANQLTWFNRSIVLVIGLALGAAAGLAVLFLEPLEIAAITMGAIVAFLTLQYPEIGALTLIFAGYTRLSDVLLEQGAPFSVVELLVGWLILVLALRWALLGEAPQFTPVGLFLLVAYGLVGLATLLYAADTGRAVAAILDYVKNSLLVLLLIITLRRPSSLRRAAWALLGAGLFLAALSVHQQLTGSFEHSYGGFSVAGLEHIAAGNNGFRIGGPMGSPNFYAMILIPLVPLALDRLWHERSGLLRLLAGGTLLVVVLSIVFTFSRGGFLALLVVGTLMLFWLRHRPVLLLALMMALLLLLPLLPAEYSTRLATIPGAVLGNDLPPAEAAIRGRTSEWIVGWQMFLDHPFGGVGWNNYPIHYLSYSSQLGLDSRRTERSAHSLYLEIAAESGLPGLVIFLFLLAAIYAALWQAYQRFRSRPDGANYTGLVTALAIGLTGYLVASLFLHAAYPRFLWTLAGIALAAPATAASSQERGGGDE